MLNKNELYQQKLTTPEKAIELLPGKGVISMGMRAATPPALLTALAKQARSGNVEQLKVYYLRCGKVAIETIFQEDLLEIFRPYSSMFTKEEVNLVNKGFAKGKKYIHFVPISFSRYPRTIAETVALHAFVGTVS